MVSTICKVYQNKLAVTVIEHVKYMSIMTNGGEDAGGVENETIHCRFVENGQPVNRLVGQQAVEYAHAGGQCQLSSKFRITFAFFFWDIKNDQTILCIKIIIFCNTIKSSLFYLRNAYNALDIRNWKTKLIGFGADGASVNLSKNAGAAAKLKEDTPWLIDIHCLPHRLELALLELQICCASVEKIYEVLHLIWKTYHFNPKSTRELKAVANTMGIGTRWLPYVSRA